MYPIKQEIRATGAVSPEIPTSVFVISLHCPLAWKASVETRDVLSFVQGKSSGHAPPAPDAGLSSSVFNEELQSKIEENAMLHRKVREPCRAGTGNGTSF